MWTTNTNQIGEGHGYYSQYERERASRAKLFKR